MTHRADDPAPPLLLDACVVLNLYASRQMSHILRSLERACLVADAVQAEALYVEHGGAGDDARERELVDLASLIAGGDLSVVRAESSDEYQAYTDFALALDDGEALTLALAEQRGYVVATDDRTARRVAAGRIPLLSTLDLVRHWIDHTAVSEARARETLVAIRQRARYLPGRDHPLQAWWEQIVTSIAAE